MDNKIRFFYLVPSMGLTGSTIVAQEILNNLDRKLFDSYIFVDSKRGVTIEQFIKNDIHRIDLTEIRRWWTKKIIYTIRYWYEIVRTLKKENADIVLVEHRDHIFKLVFLKLLFGLKFKIVSRFGNIVSKSIQKQSKEYRKAAKYFSRVDRIILPSEMARQDFIKYFGFPSSKVISIYNTISPTRFKANNTGLPNNLSNGILYVGTLDKRKDPLTLLYAYKELIEDPEFENFQLWFLGEGPLKQNMKQYIIDNNLSNKAFLLGNIVDPSAFYKHSKLYVHCSHYDGFAISVAEAVYFNISLVFSDAPVGVNELLYKYKIGRSFQTGNSQELLNKMKLELKSPSLEDSSRLRFLEEISEKKFIDNYQNLFLEVMQKPIEK